MPSNNTATPTATATDIDQLCVNTMRMLSIDAVQKAKSCHPGAPLGASPVLYSLWQHCLRYAPDDPNWIDRDRFVLSNGHACAMLYAILYLADVRAAAPSYHGEARPAVTLDDLKTFRQLDSRCTGHPEHGWTSGIETTTGPLGQGAATSVGMAMAGKWLAATFNRDDCTLFEHNVYAMCSDGCIMEGVTAEAASMAGHLALDNLCWLYDDNRITIEGSTALTLTEDVGARFESYGWKVARVDDANDLVKLAAAYDIFLATTDRPTLIIVRSHIGYGSPHKHDTKEAHGEPLGEEEVRLTKQFFGWDPDAQFYVPPGVREHLAAQSGNRGRDANAQWQQRYADHQRRYPDEHALLELLVQGGLPTGWESALPEFAADAKGLATRDAAGKVQNAVAARIPWLLGGAADLSPSTKTNLTFAAAGEFEAPDDQSSSAGSYTGRNMHFGLREHAMCAIANGMALSGLRPYVSSFLVFSDYCRGSIRLAAMMALPIAFIWTHDSIWLGEDGPTHQPIEHLASLRAMPGMMTLRPADANETAQAWRLILERRDHPWSLILTRQPLPTLDRTRYAPATGLMRGAYVLIGDDSPEVILIATGSEVALCVDAYEKLRAEGVRARVVSMPSWELFAEQDPVYRDTVLPPRIVARVAVEAAATLGWERHVGMNGAIIGMHSFGASAPGK